MPTRREILTPLGSGSQFREAGDRFGIPAGQAYMIATGLSAAGCDVPTEEELHARQGVMAGGSQALVNRPDGDELASVGPAQEHELKLALNELSSISPSQESDECADTVAGRLRAHFSYEQSQVWPRRADAVPAAEAEDLLRRWQRARPAAATRPHPQLPSGPTVLGPAMPVLAATDRWLDAATGLLAIVDA